MIQITRISLIIIVILAMAVFMLPSLIIFQHPLISFAQQSLNSVGSTQSESVTSANDAVVKAILIISQVAVLGLTFNHFFFQMVSNKKKIQIYSKKENKKKNPNNNINHSNDHDQNLKRFTILVVLCCISIIIASTAIILLSSYELSQNLSMDLSSAFSIIYSTSVGQSWLIRIITASIIAGIIISYNLLKKRQIKKKNVNDVKDDSSNNQIQEKIRKNPSIRVDSIFLIGIMAISSANLFSNSMVSHSNTGSSFSILGISVDWVHFMAVSVWVGGLFYLSIILLKSKRSSIGNIVYNKVNNKNDIIKNIGSIHKLSILLMYFSYVAIVSLTVIGVSGLYLSLTHLQHLIAVFTTLYGQILVIKLCLAFPMIVLGRYHQHKIQNHMALILNTINSNYDKELDTFSSHSKKIIMIFNTINLYIKVESLIGISVLIVASFLSITSPPSVIPAQDQSQNPTLNGTNVNLINSNTTIGMNFIILVITLSIVIIIIGTINFRKNQRQIKNIPVINYMNI